MNQSSETLAGTASNGVPASVIGSSCEWETPWDFFNLLNEEFHFSLDVCATKETAKCVRYFTKRDNAFLFEWSGSCWMNPPYIKDIGLWVGKAWESAQAGSTVVALLQGRSVDTKWFHSYVMKSSEIRFVKDRIHFGLNGKFSRANISSMVVVFRPYCNGPPTVSAIELPKANVNQGNWLKVGK